MDGEIEFLQCRGLAVEEGRSRPHGFEPLQRVVVGIYVKFVQHQVWVEFGGHSDNG